MKKNYTPEDELLFLSLGGSGEIGMNVNLYGCQGRWLMVDLGMTFSGEQYPGVDLVFADLEFIEDRLDSLEALVITHGHEDHIGAIPYFAADLGVPIYATPFTAELVRRKLQEAGIAGEVEVNVIEDDHGEFSVGPFDITYIPLSHSIAEGNALLIETPQGRVFHTGDWKLDEDPIIGEPTSEEDLRAIGEEGVLALVCDSTNVFNANPSGSEGAVHRGLMDEISRHEGKRVLVTTFASNVARLHTLGEVARETGRQICVAGRSLDRIIAVAQDNGYLLDFPEPVDFETAMGLPRGELLICLLYQNRLAERGIVMVTDKQNLIHVSGHPGRPELEALYSWLEPEILVPVHGETRHLFEQARLGEECGIPHNVVQKSGDIIRLAPGKPGKIGEVHTGRLVLDGDIISPADGEAVVMRRRLSRDGVMFVVLDDKFAPRIETLGLPLDEDQDEFIAEASADVTKAISRLKGKDGRDPASIHEAARLAARRAAQRWSGKRPQVRVMLPSKG